MGESGRVQLLPVAGFPMRLAARAIEVLPGLLLCAAIGGVSVLIATFLPVLGAPIPAIVIGVLVSLLIPLPVRLRAGIAYSSRFVLQCAVVLLGAQLSLGTIVAVGARSLPVMLATLVVCLIAASLLGRALHVDRDLRVLIGVGTGICGASAIAAVAPVIGAKTSQISYAVSTIFLFNVLAVILFPPLGRLLGMGPHAFGLFAGTAVNDTSSVVAAASVYSAAALGFAVVVKLVRTLMIIPVSAALAVIEARRRRDGERLTGRRVAGLVPWFLIGFVVVALVNSTGAIAPPVTSGLVHASVALIAVALAAVGLSTDVAAIRRAGWRPLALGAILWLLVTGTSLVTMWGTGMLR